MRSKYFILPAEEVHRRLKESEIEAERILKMIDDYNTKYPKPSSTDTAAITVSNSKK